LLENSPDPGLKDIEQQPAAGDQAKFQKGFGFAWVKACVSLHQRYALHTLQMDGHAGT